MKKSVFKKMLSRAGFHFFGLRRDGFGLHGLCRYTHGNGKWRNVPGSHAHGADQSVLVHANAAHDGCMIGDACARADFRLRIGHDHAVVEVVLVGVHVGVVGNGAALMDHDFAPVIEQNVLVNHAVVFDREVVSVGDFHAVEDLYVFADVLENVTGQHVTHAVAKPVV